MTARAPAATAPPASDGSGGDGLPVSRFHLVALAFQRAKQLQAGARPRVDAAGHKATRVALLEVMADTVSWTILDKVPPRDPGAPQR